MEYYYMRGVAPKEAREAIIGRDGRVSNNDALTFRGKNEPKLAFAMNEPKKKGISKNIVEEFLIDASYYANLGAYAEANSHLPEIQRRNLSSNHRGYLLVFNTEEPLEVNKANLCYGDSWRTTSRLPKGIEKNLVGIIPAPIMKSASKIENYSLEDYSLTRKIKLEDFDILNKKINKTN
jgi:hypothetical protein